MPQFFTSLAVLSAVLVVSQLVRLSEILVAFGLTLENILLPFLFIILPFLSFTIPMAYLFAVLLAFSRLSADGEFTALLAAGYSLARAAKPVLIVGAVLYVIAASCGVWLESWGRREMVEFYHRKAQTELDNMVKFKMQSGVFLDDFLGYVLYAEKISADRTRFDNVMLAPGARSKDQKRENFTLLAPSGSIFGSVEDSDLKMSFDYGVIYSTEPDSDKTTVVKFKRAEIDLLSIFHQQIFGSMSNRVDFRSLPPNKLRKYINEMRGQRHDSKKKMDRYLQSWYLFHQRIAFPFATIIFALIALVLGIQDQRRGRSSAYVGAIITLILAYILMMLFKWLAENDHLAAPLAAWAPNFLMMVFAGFLIYQKNRLPPSESTLDPHNIPFVSKFFKMIVRP